MVVVVELIIKLRITDLNPAVRKYLLINIGLLCVYSTTKMTGFDQTQFPCGQQQDTLFTIIQ